MVVSPHHSLILPCPGVRTIKKSVRIAQFLVQACACSGNYTIKPRHPNSNVSLLRGLEVCQKQKHPNICPEVLEPAASKILIRELPDVEVPCAPFGYVAVPTITLADKMMAIPLFPIELYYVFLAMSTRFFSQAPARAKCPIRGTKS